MKILSQLEILVWYVIFVAILITFLLSQWCTKKAYCTQT